MSCCQRREGSLELFSLCNFLFVYYGGSRNKTTNNLSNDTKWMTNKGNIWRLLKVRFNWFGTNGSKGKAKRKSPFLGHALRQADINEYSGLLSCWVGKWKEGVNVAIRRVPSPIILMFKKCPSNFPTKDFQIFRFSKPNFFKPGSSDLLRSEPKCDNLFESVRVNVRVTQES